MSPDSFAERVAALAEKWNEVEELLKKGENISENAIIPAINELRYAGRRIVNAHDAYVKQDDASVEKFIIKADDDLNQAKHDTIDAIFRFVSKNSKKLVDKIGMVAAKEHFPKYGELFALIQKIESSMAQSRSKRDAQDDIYAEIAKDGGELWRLCELGKEFSASVPAIEETIKQKEREIKQKAQREKRTERISWISLIVIILSLIFGLLGLK